jgi:acyl-CoA synthetase (AMP-forming)/AMP-acid ligase II
MNSTIFHLIERQARERPDAVAIAAPGRLPLTFGRLLSHIDETTMRLRTLGVGRNDCVAIALPNGPEMVAAFLAVASAGICAPLNPACRSNEYEFYFSSLGAKRLIVLSGMDSPAVTVAQNRSIPVTELSPLPQAAAGIFSLRGDTASRSTGDDSAQTTDIALMLHTSGTTSRPKLVLLTHAHLIASAENIAASLQLTAEDRCLNVMPLFHIHGLVGAVLSSLLSGGSVACAPGFDAERFFPWMEELRPTWYTAVPTIHQAALSCAKSHAQILQTRPFRFIRSSSAALNPQLMRGMEDTFHAPVIEAYGMTEASHQIASNPLPPRKRKAGSVGLPTGTEIAVINAIGDLVTAGQVGEIVIRGASVISSYSNDAETDESSFQDGWFKTGDQGYLDADGYLFITGRLKEVVNRGGEKISLREIDEALLEHPQVSQAAAFAMSHPSLGEDIAVAVVSRDNMALTVPMIRHYLAGRLAYFKIPSRIWIVDEIPKNATGKIQRSELTERFSNARNTELALPKSDLETLVAGIYTEVLGIQNISANDNFFALGGDSLKATQVLSRMRAVLQVNLPIATLFRKPTVAELTVEILVRNTPDPKAIEQALKDLESLSDEDTQTELGAMAGRNPSSK